MNKVTLEIFDKKNILDLIGWFSNSNNRKYMLTQSITKEKALKMIRNEEDRKCYCIKLDKKAIGYIVLMNIQSGIARLVIMIDEAFTGKGYGFKSLTLLEEEARKLNVKKLTLEVRTDNAPAISLYEKFGFNSKYVEVVMEKDI